MTGFGRGTAAGEGFDVSVEVNSVNRKSLETTFSLPKDWQIMERPIAEAVRHQVSRGRIHINVHVDTTQGKGGLAWDEALVASTIDRFEILADRLRFKSSRDPDLLLRIVMALQSSSHLPDGEAATPVVLQALSQAMDQLLEMRAKEGTAMAADLRNRMDGMSALLETIRGEAEGRPAQYREMLLARLRQAGLELELNDERVLKEVAIFADRCDISEEITRLESHLIQFQETMVSDTSQGVGRKLEFLLQEINREFNTIGAKANKIEISKCVIEAKNEIERVREQIQNIE